MINKNFIEASEIFDELINKDVQTMSRDELILAERLSTISGRNTRIYAMRLSLLNEVKSNMNPREKRVWDRNNFLNSLDIEHIKKEIEKVEKKINWLESKAMSLKLSDKRFNLINACINRRYRELNALSRLK